MAALLPSWRWGGRHPQWLSGKESACNAGDTGDWSLIPWVRKILWRRG